MNRPEYNKMQYEAKRKLNEAIKRYQEQHPEEFAKLQEKAKQTANDPPVRTFISYKTHNPNLSNAIHVDLDKLILESRNGRKSFYIHTKDSYGDEHIYFENLFKPDVSEATQVLESLHSHFRERAETIQSINPCLCPLCK